MARLLILGPSYRRNPSPEPLPAIERYDGLFYRIVRRHVNKLREKDIDVIIITEDLDVVTPETKLPYKPPVGESWRSLPPIRKDPERVELLKSRILELVRERRYEEIFIALNKHYQELLPDLTAYTRKVIASFKGMGPKAQALKKWLTGEIL
ncbi:MAG: hypothetical protein DRN04_10845 [Thermoprotei archaeon]|nr:MAG: hypothetical protein DRN04_10845 [Thermoprotei archaeon]